MHLYITIIIKLNWLRWCSVLQSFYSKVVNLVVIEQIQIELIWVYLSNQLSAFHVIVHLDLPLITNNPLIQGLTSVWPTVACSNNMTDTCITDTHLSLYFTCNTFAISIRMNIQQRWCHHADLPLPGVQSSHPMLFMIAQPRQGSWRVDTWRK